MNACEDQTEPLGEAPEVGVPIMKFGPTEHVTRYRARCTRCGYTLSHLLYDTAEKAIDEAVQLVGWSMRTSGPAGSRVELLCLQCQGGHA